MGSPDVFEMETAVKDLRARLLVEVAKYTFSASIHSMVPVLECTRELLFKSDIVKRHGRPVHNHDWSFHRLALDTRDSVSPERISCSYRRVFRVVWQDPFVWDDESKNPYAIMLSPEEPDAWILAEWHSKDHDRVTVMTSIELAKRFLRPRGMLVSELLANLARTLSASAEAKLKEARQDERGSAEFRLLAEATRMHRLG